MALLHPPSCALGQSERKPWKLVNGLLVFAVELLFVNVPGFLENLGFRAGTQPSPWSCSGEESGTRSHMGSVCFVLDFPKVWSLNGGKGKMGSSTLCAAVPSCLETLLQFLLKFGGECRNLRVPGQGTACTNIRKPEGFFCAVDEQEEGETDFPFWLGERVALISEGETGEKYLLLPFLFEDI